VRSAAERRALLLVAVLSLAALRSMPAIAAQPDTTAATPDDTTIARALADVKRDPNFTTSRTIKTLKWKTPATPKKSSTPEWLQWIVDLARWFDQAARLLIWCAVALLAGLLGAYIYRLARARAERSGDRGFIAPTHVQDLDIRPESLPDDIGAAARALWDRGEHRAALALLYRGLLSRLAHAYQVPIRDSSTEGDCLALASTHLDRARHEYASRLVRVWQRNVYGHEAVETPLVHALCDGFSPALDAAGGRA
jgi:hypothetical protein